MPKTVDLQRFFEDICLLFTMQDYEEIVYPIIAAYVIDAQGLTVEDWLKPHHDRDLEQARTFLKKAKEGKSDE